VSEVEAISIISQFIGWAGLIAFVPLLYRFGYAFSYYLTGRLKKHQKLIIQYKKDDQVINEIVVNLDSKSPLIKQIEAAKRGTL
jgi:hypothetical protein